MRLVDTLMSMKNCENCDKEFEAKRADAKTCSPKCRNELSRKQKKGEAVDTSHIEPEPGEEQEPEVKLSKTDPDFEDSDPGYYKFADLEWRRTCILPDCTKELRTRLKLLKVCSVEHQQYLLRRLTGAPK